MRRSRLWRKHWQQFASHAWWLSRKDSIPRNRLQEDNAIKDGHVHTNRNEHLVGMHSIEAYEPKIFNWNPRPEIDYIWNLDKVLECKWIVKRIKSNRIHEEEFVRFSSSRILWLGSIYVQHPKRGKCYDYREKSPYVSAISVNEIEKPGKTLKLIFEQSVSPNWVFEYCNKNKQNKSMNLKARCTCLFYFIFCTYKIEKRKEKTQLTLKSITHIELIIRTNIRKSHILMLAPFNT